MGTISLIDFRTGSAQTGVNTYIRTFVDHYPKHSARKLLVFVLQADHNQQTTVGDVEIIALTKPDKPLSRIHEAEYWADRIIGILRGHPEPYVFHFNWMENFTIAHFLKTKVACRTLLTVHYVPWKNMATINYRSFYAIHQHSLHKDRYLSDRMLFHERNSYHVFDRIITVTESAKKNLTDLFRIPERKIRCIHNGIPKPKTVADREALRKKYHIPQDEFVLLHIGSINKRKGISELLQTFEEIVRKGYQNLRLVLAGSDQIDRFLLPGMLACSKITWMGHQPQQTISELIALSDVGFLLSHTEQCSYAVIEMMSRGLPVIVTNTDGLAEMVETGRSGLRIDMAIEQTGIEMDKSQLICSLEALMNDRRLRKRLSEGARAAFQERFGADQMFKKTDLLYEDLLAPKNTAHCPPVHLIVPIPEQLTDLAVLSLTNLLQEAYAPLYFHFFLSENDRIVGDKVRGLVRKTPHHCNFYPFQNREDAYKRLFERIETFSDGSYLMVSLLDGLADRTRISDLVEQFRDNENAQVSSSLCFTLNNNFRTAKRQNSVDFDKKFSELLHCMNRLLRVSNVLYRVSFLKSKKDLLMDLDLALWPCTVPFRHLTVLDQYEYSMFQTSISSHLNLFNDTSLSCLSTKYAELMEEKNDRSAFREFVEICYGLRTNRNFPSMVQKLKSKAVMPQEFVGTDFEGILRQNF